MGSLSELRRSQTALEQIGDQVQHLLLSFKPRELVVRVGDSAARAIACQLDSKQLPATIHGVRVEQTDKFRGWEVYANGREVE